MSNLNWTGPVGEYARIVAQVSLVLISVVTALELVPARQRELLWRFVQRKQSTPEKGLP